jgi:hypothetical protein
MQLICVGCKCARRNRDHLPRFFCMKKKIAALIAARGAQMRARSRRSRAIQSRSRAADDVTQLAC